MEDKNTSISARCYRLICLKRSNWQAYNSDDYVSDWFDNAELVFWRSDFAGYTDNIDEAGIYTLEQLDKCGGSHLDWFACPIWPHRL